jgi:nucleotide-binding universal stress UspA family protein
MRDFIGRSILAATDLTRESDPVLRTAAAIASRSGATLHVIHAFDIPRTPYVEAPAAAFTFQRRLDDSEAELRRQVDRCVPADVVVGSRVVDIYTAHRAILDRAEAVEASLVVVGPHTRGALDFGFLGTTADRVIRASDVPVLVAHGVVALPLRRVLVPLDLSERARGALDVALGWAAGLGAHDASPPLPAVEVEILHVVPRMPGMADPPFARAAVEPGLNADVARAMRDVPCADELDVTEEIVWGERPDREIVRRAAEGRAGLVVMATHGYGAVKRALIGGVASAVTRDAPCPVLLVPPSLWVDVRDEEGEGAADAVAPASRETQTA